MIPRPEHARLSTTAATTATVPAEFTWNDSYLLGYGPMDDTHREFVEVVARLSASGDGEFAALLEEFRIHT